MEYAAGEHIQMYAFSRYHSGLIGNPELHGNPRLVLLLCRQHQSRGPHKQCDKSKRISVSCWRRAYRKRSEPEVHNTQQEIGNGKRQKQRGKEGEQGGDEGKRRKRKEGRVFRK